MKQCKRCGKFYSDYAQTCSFCRGELRPVGSAENSETHNTSFEGWNKPKPKQSKPAAKQNPKPAPDPEPQTEPDTSAESYESAEPNTSAESYESAEPDTSEESYESAVSDTSAETYRAPYTSVPPQSPKITKFPLLPVIIGVPAAIIAALAILFVTGNSSSKSDSSDFLTSDTDIEENSQNDVYLSDMSKVEDICAKYNQEAIDGTLIHVSVSSTVTSWMDNGDIVILKADSGTDGSDFDRVWYCYNGDIIYVSYEGSSAYHMYFDYGEPFVVRYWDDFSDSDTYTDFTDEDNMNTVYTTFIEDFDYLSEEVLEAAGNSQVLESQPATTAETTAAATTAAETPVAASADYIFSNSDYETISESQYSALSAWELRIAINEIYARHGRRFKDTQLQDYFDSKSWYNGTIDATTFDNTLKKDSTSYGMTKIGVKNATNMRRYYDAHYK